MTTIDEVVSLLTNHYGLAIKERRTIQSGVQIVTVQGPKVNVFDTGKVVPNGTKLELIADLKDRLESGSTDSNTSRKVFVVYGHDDAARVQLEAMLRRWNLEPILLNQLTSEGDTLIEKLERYMPEAVFAVVLATPDDEGHVKGKPDQRQFRARQNVVLELGMMLRGLGRKKVAVLMPNLDTGVMEKPSDIAGLLYIPYTDNVDDAKLLLAKELNKQKLHINLNDL